MNSWTGSHRKRESIKDATTLKTETSKLNKTSDVILSFRFLNVISFSPTNTAEYAVAMCGCKESESVPKVDIRFFSRTLKTTKLLYLWARAS